MNNCSVSQHKKNKKRIVTRIKNKKIVTFHNITTKNF
jgi:hypothetical protein